MKEINTTAPSFYRLSAVTLRVTPVYILTNSGSHNYRMNEWYPYAGDVVMHCENEARLKAYAANIAHERWASHLANIEEHAKHLDTPYKISVGM